MARTKFKVKEGISVADDNSPGGYPLIPVGTVVQFAGTSAPEGWLLCNGAAVSRTDYANLWATISTTYGSGDGSTTFNVPNALGRTVVGAGSGAGLTTRSLAATGGAETVTLTGAQSGTSAHGHGNTISASTGTVSSDHVHNANHAHSASSGVTGIDHAHLIGSHSHTYKVASTATAGTNRAIITSTGSGEFSGGINAETIGQAGNTYSAGSNHSHTVTVDGNNFNTGGISANHTHAVTVSGSVSTSTAANASESHENMMPFLVLNYIIKY